MVNIDDFIKRLEIILDYYSLSASGFADKINVQRSSLSHLLSGRNKPSLDLIMKIVEIFPDVDLYWILNGVGSFPKSEVKEIPKPAAEIIEIPKKNIEVAPILTNFDDENLFSVVDGVISEPQKNEPKIVAPEIEASLLTSKTISKPISEIEKIVVFYNDGTFSDYKPR